MGDDQSGILGRFDLARMWVDWKQKGLQVGRPTAKILCDSLKQLVSGEAVGMWSEETRDPRDSARKEEITWNAGGV